MFTGHLSGVLLLAFKIILLLPILGILTAIYEKYRDRHVNQLKGISESDRYQSEPVIIMLPRYVISWILLAALPLIGYLIIRFFVSDSSPVNRWLISKDIASWAPTAMHIIGIIIIVAIAMRIIIEPSTRIISVMGFNVLTSITVVMRRVRHLVVATLAACAVTVALLPSGVTHTAPALEHGDDIAATADWYFWHLAEIIPFVAVPQPQSTA